MSKKSKVVYPLSNDALSATIIGSAREGIGFSGAWGVLRELGYDMPMIRGQLLAMGYKPAQIRKITTASPSVLRQIAGAAWFIVPAGAAAAIADGGAEAGAAGAAASGEAGAAGAGAGGAAGTAKSLLQGGKTAAELGALGSAIEFLTSASNWKRIGQVLLGGVLILMGLRTLSGHTVTPATVVTAPAKATKKVVASKVA